MAKLENPQGSANSSGPIKLYAFVSSATPLGNMLISGAPMHPNCGSFSAMDAADCYCQNRAQESGWITATTKKFVAWLSNSSRDMTCRIQDIQGVGCPLPNLQFPATWYNLNEQVIADSHTRLFSIGVDLINPLTRTDAGANAVGGANVWSATTGSGFSSGAPAANHCADWSVNASQTAATGSIGGTGSTWSALASASCASSAHFYCFGIPK